MSCRLTKWLLITLLFSPLIAQAQFNADMVIEKARGKKVVFSLGFDNIKPGDVLIALDERDRRRGVVKVLKVGRNKALGSVLKGQALNGWFLEKYKRQKRKSKRRPKKRPSFEDEFGEEEDSEDDFERNDENEYENDEAEEDGFSDESSDEEEDDFDAYDKPKKRSRVDLNRKRKGGRVYYVGALLSKSSYTLNVDIPNGDSTTSVSMTDSPTNFHAYLRTRFNDTFDIIATLGSESYSSTGEVTDSACSGSNECQTNVNYISLRGLAAYKLDFAANVRSEPGSNS